MTTKKTFLTFKDICLTYLTKGIPGVSEIPTTHYSGDTARKVLRWLSSNGNNIAALEAYFMTHKKVGLHMTNKRVGPQVGESKFFKVQKLSKSTRSFIQLPLDIFNVSKEESVFVTYEEGVITVYKDKPSTFPIEVPAEIKGEAS